MQNPSQSSTNPADVGSTSRIEESVLSLVIPNFSEMQETIYSPIVDIHGIPWRIKVMRRYHVVLAKGTQRCLGFFLECCPTSYTDNWSCEAKGELRLISQKPGVDNFTRKTTHSYTSREHDWGYTCFMVWDEILDEAKGYIKDNTIKLEATIEAGPLKNALNQAQFQKKVREYLRLADVQTQRGFINKALEVNANASKFCKNLDIECKNEIEAQLKRLSELKLKQSTKRIEKVKS